MLGKGFKKSLKFDRLWNEKFNGYIGLPIWQVESAAQEHTIGFSNTISREGESIRLELRRDDPLASGSKRVEVVKIKPENRLTYHVYKLSTYLPNGGDDDWGIGENDDEIITQWHASPDPGEDWLFPPISLHLGYGNNYYLALYTNAEEITNETGLTTAGYPHYFELFNWVNTKGYWVDWEFRIKWGWMASHYPKIEVYKQIIGIDAEKSLILTVTEPNCFNDRTGLQWSFGIYKPQWALDGYGGSEFTKRVIYIDAVSLK